MVKDYLKPRTGTVLDKGRSSAKVDAGGVVTPNVSVARSIDYNDLKNHDLVGLEWVGDQAYIVSILTWDQAATVLGDIETEFISEDGEYLEVDADEDEETTGDYVMLDGSTPMTANWDAGDYIITNDIFDADTEYRIEGVHALSIPTGMYSVVVGNTTSVPGYWSVIIGDAAAEDLTSAGTGSVIIGWRAARTHDELDDNVIIGMSAAEGGSVPGKIWNNVIIGAVTAAEIEDGSYDNTIVGSWAAKNIDGIIDTNAIYGYFAAYDIRDGAWGNTIIGPYAGANMGANEGCVFLGYGAGDLETGSHKLYIGTLEQSWDTPLIYGEFDNQVVVINGTLHVTGGII